MAFGFREIKSVVMRLNVMNIVSPGVACVLGFVLFVGFVFDNAAHAKDDNGPLLEIVEQSCSKACIKGRGDKAFCKSYCSCVRGRVKNLAERTDISKVLQGERQQVGLIHQCSGETAVEFFSQSCQKKCSGADQCTTYCACLKEKITKKRKFSEIGAFFIQLGKNDNGALGQLKRYEQSCSTKRP